MTCLEDCIWNITVSIGGNSDLLTLYHTYSKNWKICFTRSQRMMDDWQYTLILQGLVWVYTIFSGLSVQVLRPTIWINHMSREDDNLGGNRYILCWHSLKLPLWGNSNEYLQRMFCKKWHMIFKTLPSYRANSFLFVDLFSDGLLCTENNQGPVVQN